MAQFDPSNDAPQARPWYSDFLFVRLFQGFRLARQLSTLSLALLGVITLFVGGWILDAFTPRSVQVVRQIVPAQRSITGQPGGFNVLSELDAYVADPAVRQDLPGARQDMRESNVAMLSAMLTDQLEMNNLANADAILSGDALGAVAHDYDDALPEALDVLEQRYDARRRALRDEFESQSYSRTERDEQEIRLESRLNDLEASYDQVVMGLLSGQQPAGALESDLARLIVVDAAAGDQAAQRELVQKHINGLRNALALARTYRVAKLAQPQGIFCAFVDFKLTQLRSLIDALIWQHKFAAVKQHAVALARGGNWLLSFHPIFSIFLVLMALVIWAIIGGAICRIAALQVAREERLGAFKALQFSMSKFLGFFTAPLLPIGLIAIISVLILLGGLLGAIPGIGEFIAGLLMPLALVGGFVIAIVAVGLAAGFPLMFPTIAVEASDGFDAISKAFSYVLYRPWRTAFYYLVATVYGGICYLFVHLFAFLMLVSVHAAAGLAMNWDSSSLAESRGKLDAIWPIPLLSDLQPAINWSSLNWTEAAGAGLICLWVALVVAAVLAFVVALYFSLSTITYLLLRKHVDDTDLEDVYVEHPIEELAQETPAETPSSAEEPPALPQDQPADQTLEETQPGDEQKPAE